MPSYRTGTGRILLKSNPILFTLQDEFNVALAAGAVNGTLANPGGMGTTAQKTRAVTDLESKLSIAAGVLTVSGGKAAPAHGDPGIWWGAQTRAAGKMLFLTYKETGGVRSTFGWFTTAATILTNNAIAMVGGSVIYIHTNGAVSAIIGAFVQGTIYRFALVLRAVGLYVFIRGGAFTNWTLLSIQEIGNTATLYPGISNYNSAFTVDGVRIPQALWLPSPAVSDSFARANGALGISNGLGHPETGIGSGGAGKAWTGATWTISGNAAINTPTEGPELSAGVLTVGQWYRITATQANYFYVGCAIDDRFMAAAATALDVNNKVKLLTNLDATTDNATADVNVDVKVAALTAKAQAGIVARVTGTTCIRANFDGFGNINIREWVAGVPASLGSFVKAFTANDYLRLHLLGTAWRLYHVAAVTNVVTLIGIGVTTVTAGLAHGLFSTLAANTITGCIIRPVGMNGEYALLDEYMR